MSNFAVRPQNTPLNLAHQVAWEKQYQQLLRQFLKTHYEFDGSAVAAWMRKQGLHDPEHHNLWGTQITYYSGLGWMTAVGRGIRLAAVAKFDLRHGLRGAGPGLAGTATRSTASTRRPGRRRR